MAALDVVRVVYAAFGRRDISAFLERTHPDVVFQTPQGLPWGGTFRGREGIEHFLGVIVGSVEALTIEPTRWISTGNGTVVVESIDQWVNEGRTLRNPVIRVWDAPHGLVTAMSEYTNIGPVQELLALPSTIL